MPYPPAIILRPCTLGGSTALESGTLLVLSAEITASRSLRWGATGWQFPSLTRTVTGTEGAELSFSLPVTDLAGWRLNDDSGSIIDVSAPGSYTHTYTVKLKTLSGGRQIDERTIGPFVLPTEDGSPIDLDLMLPVPTVAGGVVLVPGTWDARVAAAEAAAAVATGLADRVSLLERAVDARAHGVLADGVTDDAPAWNALVRASPPGTVLTWTGRSVLMSRIIWKTGVSLVGQGWGNSILATVHPTNSFPAISWVPGDGASINNPIEDCTFSNFEIDGSGLARTDFIINGKGIFTQWQRRCQFLNLYIHDTIATGLGTDFMPDCLIHGVIAERCGRNHTGGDAGGGAGIGIGTGAWEEESTTISDCHAINNGNWGIFVEYQETEPYRGRGLRVVNCTATGNAKGFGDRGTAGTLFSGCYSYLNNNAGFDISFGARDGIIANCVSHHNGTSGIRFYLDTLGRYAVRGCRTYANAHHGINVEGHIAPISAITLEGNECYDNLANGILCVSSTGGMLPDLTVRGNRCANNGRGGGTNTRGIMLNCSTSGMQIDGNRCYDDQAVKTQQVGIQLSASAMHTMTDGSISGNNLVGNASLALSRGAAARTRIRIDRNDGWVTEAAGTATIADGASTLAVQHGMSSAAGSVQITPRANEAIWVSARSTTAFTVARVGTVGALQFDWRANTAP